MPKPSVFFNTFGHAVTLTFVLLAPKTLSDQVIFVPRCTTDKIGKNPLMHTTDIAETTNGWANICRWMTKT